MTAGTAPSLTQAIAPLDLGAHVTGIGWLKGTAAIALGDGAVILVKDGATHRIEVHPGGGILTAAGNGERFVTGGDDGRVAVTGPDGSTTTLAEAKNAWIDAIAVNANGAFAFAAGKRVVARDDKGREKIFEAPSTPRGLAFAPKGYRLAVSHYNGVSLWFPNLETKPEFLEWKGSHIDVTWSPDGRFVVTSMQENALHGWRLQPDKGHMRMSGYPAKTRSVSWSGDGKWLATSGAEAAIIHHLAVRFQGRPDRKGAARMRCAARHRESRRLSPEHLCAGRWLRGWLYPADPPHRCVRTSGPAHRGEQRDHRDGMGQGG
jgi:hypothetical protein